MTSIGRSRSPDVDALALLFAVSGVVHLVRPEVYLPIVPRRLPHARGLVLASGGVELMCAVGLMVPATRRVAGLVSVALLVAVFPANVKHCLIAFDKLGPVARATTVLRLPLQLPMIRTAWRVAART